MMIATSNDHAGFALKGALIGCVRSLGHDNITSAPPTSVPSTSRSLARLITDLVVNGVCAGVQGLGRRGDHREHYLLRPARRDL